MKHALEIVTLGRLIEVGIIKRTARNDQLIKRFDVARWIEPTGRKDEWRARIGAISNLEARIDTLLPSWSQEFNFLRSLELDPFDPRSIEALAMLRKNQVAIGMVNRRNWNAATGLGPKHSARKQASVTLTKDWVMRFRPNTGLCGVFGGNQIDLGQLSKTLSECVIPERLWLRFERFEGVLPRLIISCENLGAYIDIPIPEEALVIYSPGADIGTAVELLKQFPLAKWIHFGDIDPDGLLIAENLAREVNRRLHFYVPSFAEEYLPGRAVKTPWAEVPDIKVFQELKRSRSRLFQEVFILDDRLGSEISTFLKSAISKSTS